MNNIADDISHAYQDGFNDGVASMARPFGNGMDVCPVCGKPSTIGKPQTNADRIRQMSDEELAEWMATKTSCMRCPVDLDACYNFEFSGEMSCKEILLDWLKSREEEEQT